MTIPKLLFRTVPSQTSDQVEGWWQRAMELHPGWDFVTYRDPIVADEFPLTHDLFELCDSGAQKAGLIRLEALSRHGGIYLDSDVEVFRNLTPLTMVEAFAAYEDPGVIPDAVLGAEAGHPAIEACLELAMDRVMSPRGDWRTAGAWGSGPGVTTKILAGRDDVLLLPPGSFYPVHYTRKGELESFTPPPWCWMAHHWHASWH